MSEYLGGRKCRNCGKFADYNGVICKSCHDGEVLDEDQRLSYEDEYDDDDDHYDEDYYDYYDYRDDEDEDEYYRHKKWNLIEKWEVLRWRISKWFQWKVLHPVRMRIDRKYRERMGEFPF